MKSILTILVCLLCLTHAQSQQQLPYYEIPAYPESYTAATVAARVIDGLGFRYYWATEGLRSEDLSYKPNDEARTSLETLRHIYELTKILSNTVHGKATSFPSLDGSLTYEQLREKTLLNIQSASTQLKSQEIQLEDHKMIFKSGDKKTEFPFWNLLNGPIDDALWHVGQVVTFRRSSGNPINGKAEVLLGKLLN